MVKPKQRLALKCVVDTLIAPVEAKTGSFWEGKATDLNVDDQLIEVLAALPRKARNDFLTLLTFLASPIPGILLHGWPGSFRSLSFKKREHLLYKWANSYFSPLRMAFTSLKRITMFCYYGSSKKGYHPAWKDMGYPGPPIAITDGALKTLNVNFVTHDKIECDVLVIGSGAGGGVVAGTLSEHGKDVVVVDKGDYVAPPERSNLEREMVSRLYESQGMQTNHNYGISLFAGSCLGGGTTVNWSVSWRPNDFLLQEWATQHSLPQLQSDIFSRCIDDVLSGINVVDKVPFNAQSKALTTGSDRLKFKSGALPQNTLGCERHNFEHCGFCLFGCRYGNKQDMNETFLRRAQAQGARIFPGMLAHILRHSQGKIKHVEAIVKDSDGVKRKVTIKAKSYVLSAGAIHTPALLLRSGLTHSQLGKNLYIHPAALALGRYPEIIESWRGGMMTAFSDAVSDLDNGYGCKIEPSPLHTGLLATVLPWANSEEHKKLMLNSPYYAGFAVITRDRFGGRVTMDKDGNPIIYYDVHSYDRQHLLKGLAAASAIHAAAGAKEIVLTHHRAAALNTQHFGCDVSKYHKEIASLNWGANYSPMFSAHLMGTCRMGGDNNKSPVNPEGKFSGMSNLYIADGSLFPSASGINPMVTIQSLARYIALGMV